MNANLSTSRLKPSAILWVLLVLSVNSLFAQASRQVVNQEIAWASYLANITTGKKTLLFIDNQFRYASSPSPEKALEPSQFLFRAHLDFKITPDFSIAPLGGALVLNHRYGKQPVAVPNDELRLYQQFMYSHKWGKATINHRIRTEERFIEEHDPVTGQSTGYTNRQFRPRYRFMATLPLNNPADGAAAFTAQVFYEGFISSGKKVTFNDVDQNRLYAGLACKPDKSLTIGLGWFYQMLIKSNGTKQENNFGTLLIVTQNIKLVD